MKVNRNVLTRTLIVGVLLFVIFEIVIVAITRYNDASIETELNKKSFAIQNQIEKVLLNVYTINDAYRFFMEENPDATQEETETFLDYLLKHEENYVNNIAYIEDTTIKYNYPYEGNESSIGIDLAEVVTQRDDILLVKNDMVTLFIGPVELVQGGNAFILRVPIVVENQYVGQIATVINADQLTELMSNQANDFNVGLELFFFEGEEFLSIGDDLDGISVTNTLESEYTKWTIIVYDLDDETSFGATTLGVRMLAIITILIVCYYVYRNALLMEENQYKAHHDSLTNDFNRMRFIDDFNEKMFVNKLIAFMDVNKFKVLNDTLGHHFGDWALMQVSGAFQDTNVFTVYRNSGDEFILVSKDNMDREVFHDVIEKLNLSFYNEELKRNIDISLSMGVIEKVPETLTIEDMLVYLDYAMYDAKRQKKSITIVDANLMEVYRKQKHMEHILIEDIKNNQLITYYQPMININTKSIEGLEVLSRWIYKDTVKSASSFIDVAKKIRYIEIMDRNLFKNLQEEYRRLSEACPTLENISFGVNLSAETLKLFEEDSQAFERFVEGNIIPKDRLTFEISEDINLGIISDETIDSIRNDGYKLVIDDFGSGVSKLTDVLSGKLFAIKTDKSMLPASKQDQKKLHGFSTIIKSINATGSTVVVEGVETKEQMEIVQTAGCNIVQGYLFGKPMSHEKIVEYINNFKFSDYE